MTINERIKYFRKEYLNLTQTAFAEKLGMKQTSISSVEKNGATVTEQTLTSICSIFKVNRNWILYGQEPMFSPSDNFNLGDYANQHGMSELELKILKIYFEFEPEKRQAALSYFLDRLKEDEASAPSHPATAQEMEEQFPPISEPVAKSTQSH